MSWDRALHDGDGEGDGGGEGDRARSGVEARPGRKDAPLAGGGTITSPIRTGSKVLPRDPDFGLCLSLGIGW